MMRGTWFWQSSSEPWGSFQVVGNATKEAQVRANFTANGISHVYGSYGNRPVSDQATIASWNTSLNTLGITNDLLLSSNSWIDPANYGNLDSKLQSRLLNFNSAVASSARFSGVHFDVEPQGLSGWSGFTAVEKRDKLFQLRDMYVHARSYLDSHGGASLTMAADLPVWFDSSPSIGWTNTAERDAWFNAIGVPLDSISLMPFDRTTFSSINNGVTWERANIAGATVRVGLEVDIPGTWPTMAAFNSMADTIETNYGESAGIDIQSYAKFAAETIPEPSSTSLVLVGGMLVVLRRRRCVR